MISSTNDKDLKITSSTNKDIVLNEAIKVESGGVITGATSVTSTSFTGDLSGNADTATKLANPKTISLSGDISGNVEFDGSSNISINSTLEETGVDNGIYGSATSIPVVTIDMKGRITSATTIPSAGKALSIIGSTDVSQPYINSYNIETITFNKDDGFTVTPSGSNVTVGLGSHWKTLKLVEEGGSIGGSGISSITPVGQEDLTIQAGDGIKITLDATPDDQKLKIETEGNPSFSGLATFNEIKVGDNTDTSILIADGDKFNLRTISGDLSMSNTGALMINNSKISDNHIDPNSSILIGKINLQTDVEEDILPITHFATTDNMDQLNNTVVPTQGSVKTYVDAVAQGLSIKDTCRLATVSDFPNTNYDVVSGELTITVSNWPAEMDSRNINQDDRILIKDQVNGADNGIYTVTSLDQSQMNIVLTRSDDFNTPDKIVGGSFTFITEGYINSDQGYVLTNDTSDVSPPVDIGSTPLSFAQFSGAGSIVAGDGIIKEGNLLSLSERQNNIETITSKENADITRDHSN